LRKKGDLSKCLFQLWPASSYRPKKEGETLLQLRCFIKKKLNDGSSTETTVGSERQKYKYRQRERQTGRQTDRQTCRQRDRETENCFEVKQKREEKNKNKQLSEAGRYLSFLRKTKKSAVFTFVHMYKYMYMGMYAQLE
jgi:hypothetical protein